MIDTKIEFKGRRVLIENDPRLSEESNRVSVRGFQEIVKKEIFIPQSEIWGLDFPLLPEPEIAYNEVTIKALTKRESK